MIIKTAPKSFYPVFLLVFNLLTGCATEPLPADGKHPCQSTLANASNDLSVYNLYINSSGNLLDIDKNPVPDPNAYLVKIFENYNRLANFDNRIQMTVFIHGGLNTSKQISGRVKSLKDRMLEDCKYPVFISWRSGFPGNYLDHLLFLRRGVYSSTGDDGSFFDGASSFINGPVVSPFVLMEDSLRAIARIPASTYNVLVDQNIFKRKLFDDSPDNSILSKDGADTIAVNKTDRINIHLPPKGEDEDLDFSDLWSVANPMKLVTAPYVDSLGSGAWSSMLRRTDLVLANDKSIPINQTKPEAFPKAAAQDECKVDIDETRTAVSEFFRYWQCHYQGNGPLKMGKPHKIDIIGHSMGSIISNKVIAKYPEISFSNIVYMAAACSLNDIAEIVSPYLIHHPHSRFYNLTLHPKRDQFENASDVDIVPRGSLLWWIDNTLAEINSFQDRTAGYWPNIYKVAPKIFPAKIQGQVHLTKFGMVGDWPQTHGSFGDFPFWREGFWTGKANLP